MFNFDSYLINYSVFYEMLVLCDSLCFFFSSRRRHTRCALVTGVQTCALPIFMGAGIAIMHYVGMSALRANCLVGYSPPLVAASFAVAVAASGFALWLAFSPTHRPHVMAGAACMGLAISGMH